MNLFDQQFTEAVEPETIEAPNRLGRRAVLPVTRPLVPDRAQLDSLLDGIFERAWFTNEGPLVDRLAEEVAAWLRVEHCQLVSSGAAALGLALDVVKLAPGSSVVTTPFSFAASAHAIALKGSCPIFADVDPDTLCLGPVQAEEAIRADTGAILGTHIFGGPCAVEAFAEIGRRRNVAVVYDGAHAFGTTVGGRSLLEWGDASAVSFHATKIFHTVEGGAVITGGASEDDYVRVAKAHGIDGDHVPFIGPNAKMSELHAACGLTLLPRIHGEIAARARLHERYREAFGGPRVRFLVPAACEWNHAYCPVLLEDEATVLRVREALAARSITARRYFYPALTTLDYYDAADCPVAEDAARRVLCLPFGSWLEDEDFTRICEIVLDALG